MELTLEEKALLMCAFDINGINCGSSCALGQCSYNTFRERGRDLLVKLGVVESGAEFEKDPSETKSILRSKSKR